jgi:hypothetical protein
MNAGRPRVRRLMLLLFTALTALIVLADIMEWEDSTLGGAALLVAVLVTLGPLGWCFVRSEIRTTLAGRPSRSGLAGR